MSGPRPTSITLSARQRASLEQLRRCQTAPVRLARRVGILGAAHDLTAAVKSQAPGWAYIRVTTEAVRARMEERP